MLSVYSIACLVSVSFCVDLVLYKEVILHVLWLREAAGGYFALQESLDAGQRLVEAEVEER